MSLRHAPNRLLVRDYAACFHFYRDVLGLEVAWGDQASGCAGFETGDVSLVIFDRGELAAAVGEANLPTFTAERDGAETVALIFTVEGVDAECDRLRARGVAFVAEPRDRDEWGLRVARFRDPDGNVIEVCSPLAAAIAA
jgi:lactoylglutathione lyase